MNPRLSNGQDKTAAWIEKYWPQLGLLAAVLIGFAPVAFFSHPLKYDLIATAYPWRYYIGECLQSLHLPLWNPYQYLGYPIHADPQSGAWYPITWVIGFFYGYDIYSTSVEFTLHLYLAGLGMMLLARTFGMGREVSFIAGVSYMACGFFVGHAQHLPWIISATWLPYIMLHYIKMSAASAQSLQATIRHALISGFFLFMSLSGGYPAFLIILGYFLATFFIYFSCRQLFVEKARKQWLKYLIGNTFIALSALAFSAILLASVWQSLSYITRGSGLNLHQSLTGPFSPQSMISFLMPFVAVKEMPFFDTDLSMTNGYFGLVLFIFLILFFGKKKPALVWIFFVWGIFALLTSMGKYLPVRQLLYDYVPLMNLFRHPGLFRLFAMMGFILCGAYGLHCWIIDKDSKRDGLKVILFLLLALAVMVAAQVFIVFKPDLSVIWSHKFHYFLEDTVYDHLLIQAIILSAFLLAIWLIIRFINKKTLLLRLLMLISFADLGVAARLNGPFTVYSADVDAKVVQNMTAYFPKGFPIPYRLPVKYNNDSLSRFQSLWHNMSCFRKQIGWDGYNPFSLRKYESLQFGQPVLFNHLIENPPIYLSDQIRKGEVLPDSPVNENFDTRTLLLNEADFDDYSKAGLSLQTSDRCAFSFFSPNKCIINTFTANQLVLTLLQNYYPGWKVKINGKNSEIAVSNLCFMSVLVPPGKSKVEFIYRPRVFPYLLISTLSLLLFLIVLIKTKPSGLTA